MERYIEFNPLKFISESPEWDNEIKKLENKKDAVLELSGQNDSVGKGSTISNPTETINIVKAEIEQEIARIEYYKHVFDVAWNQLSDEDKIMINGYFFKKYGKVRDFVNNYARENCTNKSYVYDARKKALAKFTRIVKENFIGE